MTHDWINQSEVTPSPELDGARSEKKHTWECHWLGTERDGGVMRGSKPLLSATKAENEGGRDAGNRCELASLDSGV